jgi:hypothetical protein
MTTASLVFADEEGVDEVAVFHFDAVDAVAGLHGGVRREDVAQNGLQAHRARAGEVRADLTAGVADLMAGHAEGAEGFSSLRIAFGGQGGEFGKFGVEGLRGFFGEQRRGVDGFGDSGTFAEFFGVGR